MYWLPQHTSLIFRHASYLPLYLGRMWRYGRKRSRSLYRKSAYPGDQDKVCLVEEATTAAKCAVEDQLEAIWLHLASSNLADDASPSTSVPGGRMWAYAPSESEPLPDTVDISASYSPSRRDLIQNLLSQLSTIKSSVHILSQTVDSELLCSNLPICVDTPFPLHHLFLECRHLESDLDKVKSKVTSVTTMKASIKAHLVTISKKLHSAKLTWK